MEEVAHASKLATWASEVAVTVSAEAGSYREIDVTGWLSAGEEQLGTKPKRWIAHPATGDRWLLKYVTYSTGADGFSYQKGDDWAERVASGVAAVLGVTAAHVELAVDQSGAKRFGIISRSVLSSPGHGGEPVGELVPGNEFLAQPARPGARSGYMIDAVHAALADVEAPTGSPSAFDAWDVFAGYLVLDGLLGNTDRHEENWAVIVSPAQRRLSPTFDHASSLGFLLSDAERSKRLATRDRGYTPEAYTRGARTPFAGKPHPIDVALAALDRCAVSVRDHWLSACSDADALVEPVWRIPNGRISEAAREFAERLLRANSARLFGQLR